MAEAGTRDSSPLTTASMKLTQGIEVHYELSDVPPETYGEAKVLPLRRLISFVRDLHDRPNTIRNPPFEPPLFPISTIRICFSERADLFSFGLFSFLFFFISLCSRRYNHFLQFVADRLRRRTLLIYHNYLSQLDSIRNLWILAEFTFRQIF